MDRLGLPLSDSQLFSYGVGYRIGMIPLFSRYADWKSCMFIHNEFLGAQRWGGGGKLV